MYDKIRDKFNELYDSNIESCDVENYLRFGDTTYLDSWEAEEIERILENLL